MEGYNYQKACHPSLLCCTMQLVEQIPWSLQPISWQTWAFPEINFFKKNFVLCACQLLFWKSEMNFVPFWTATYTCNWWGKGYGLENFQFFLSTKTYFQLLLCILCIKTTESWLLIRATVYNILGHSTKLNGMPYKAYLPEACTAWSLRTL